MINTAEVMLWGTRIGIIHMNEANGSFPNKRILRNNLCLPACE